MSIPDPAPASVCDNSSARSAADRCEPPRGRDLVGSALGQPRPPRAVLPSSRPTGHARSDDQSTASAPVVCVRGSPRPPVAAVDTEASNPRRQSEIAVCSARARSATSFVRKLVLIKPPARFHHPCAPGVRIGPLGPIRSGFSHEEEWDDSRLRRSRSTADTVCVKLHPRLPPAAPVQRRPVCRI